MSAYDPGVAVLDGLRGWLAGVRQRRTMGTLGSGTQPWTRIVWPSLDDAGLPLVVDAMSAYRLPSVARAVQVYTGMCAQMPLDDVKDNVPARPAPRLLQSPDPRPNWPRSRFVAVSVADYLLNGNAVCLVTSRDTTGFPAACVWIPAGWVALEQTGYAWPDDLRYWVGGQQLTRADVVHVARGADPNFPDRGMGIVEQHLSTLERVAGQETYERQALKDGAVPSVAVITNNRNSSDAELKAAKTSWMGKFAGPKREPVFLPSGAQVVPLSWSPTDNQLIEARKMSLVDVANLFNLDAYWLSAPAASMTYQSPGPMFTNLLRVSLEPVLSDFEGVWSQAWLPRGRTVRFDRLAATRDDFASTITTLLAATAGERPLITVDEARAYLGWTPFPETGEQ